jgi:3-hydroxyacyl-CoA dehydrogenase
MPEVTLGIVPGAEGTQRLPRLVGIEAAIALCVSGQPIPASEALRIGLVDRAIEGDVRTGAIAFAAEVVRRGGPHSRNRDRRDKLVPAAAAAALAAAGRELARRNHPHLEAPLRVVEAIEAAASLSFADGCRHEREIARRQMDTTEARTLLHAFFAERAARRLRKTGGGQ